MKVEVIAPEEFLGEIIGQLNAAVGKSSARMCAWEIPRHRHVPLLNVWLRHRFTVCHAGTWCFYHGIRPLFSGI